MASYRIVKKEDVTRALQGEDVGRVVDVTDPSDGFALVGEGEQLVRILNPVEAAAREAEIRAAKAWAAENAARLAEEAREREIERERDIERMARSREELARQREIARLRELALEASPCAPPVIDGFESIEDLYKRWDGAEYALRGCELLFAYYDDRAYSGTAHAVWLRGGISTRRTAPTTHTRGSRASIRRIRPPRRS